MPPRGSSGGPVAPAALLDTHVHFHACFDPATFLQAADGNFARAAHELGLGGDAAPLARVLLVMEIGDDTLIGRLERAGERAELGGWIARPTAEPGSLALDHPRRQTLLVVEGRQTVTAERLEVLATPCPLELPSGLPLGETLDAAERRRAVPILPWGFGKWTGRRGRAVAGLLESWSPGRLLLADNGGRPALSWKPRLLTLGAQRGFPVVRGSDPLPLAPEVHRVGAFGSLLQGPFDGTRPVSGVRSLLGGLRQPPRAFGRGVDPFTFLNRQLRLRLRRGTG